jgi:hypothetical protein
MTRGCDQHDVPHVRIYCLVVVQPGHGARLGLIDEGWILSLVRDHLDYSRTQQAAVIILPWPVPPT